MADWGENGTPEEDLGGDDRDSLTGRDEKPDEAAGDAEDADKPARGR
ncbi:MAG: hypothetical protein ACPIOQ_29340 [Promethearchaeia archaeon]